MSNVYVTGADPGGGLEAMVIIIYIAIIHIIILNEVHCILLKYRCMNLLAAVPAAQQLYS